MSGEESCWVPIPLECLACRLPDGIVSCRHSGNVCRSVKVYWCGNAPS
jgi:hypothetical protein